MGERKSKVITDKAILDKLFSITEDDITSSFIFSLFGEFGDKNESLVKPYDIITVPPGVYGPENKKNKNSFVTTVGIFVLNKWFFEKELFDLFGYINTTYGKKAFGKVNQQLSYALMEDRITVQQMKNYLEKTQLIMPFVSIISPNQSEKILTCTKAINKKKEELVKKYKKELDAGNVKVINDMEKELLDFAVEYVGDDPSMDSFISGARGNIGNNFKNMYVMKGAVRNPDPNAKQQYDVALSNYTDGISKEEYNIYANSASFGPYSRGKKTEYGGYLENLFAMSYQDLILGDKKDCGCGRYRIVEITEKNINLVIYNNIVNPDGSLTELNSTNIDKYIGKKVKMRYADLCTEENPCRACAGNYFYKLGIKNVGTTMMQIASTIKNKSMKAFHDSTIGTNEIDPMEMFGFK